jgi:DNA repair/transcription protein MET18/MMS19
MRALTVHPRYAVFSILDTLVSNHRESTLVFLSPAGLGYWTDEMGDHTGLKSMGEGFVTGYLGIADGEKDPRNLLLAFSIDRVVLIEFDTSLHVQVSFLTSYLKWRIDSVTHSPSSTSPSVISQSPSDLRRMIRMASRLNS